MPSLSISATKCGRPARCCEQVVGRRPERAAAVLRRAGAPGAPRAGPVSSDCRGRLARRRRRLAVRQRRFAKRRPKACPARHGTSDGSPSHSQQAAPAIDWHRAAAARAAGVRPWSTSTTLPRATEMSVEVARNRAPRRSPRGRARTAARRRRPGDLDAAASACVASRRLRSRPGRSGLRSACDLREAHGAAARRVGVGCRRRSSGPCTSSKISTSPWLQRAGCAACRPAPPADRAASRSSSPAGRQHSRRPQV